MRLSINEPMEHYHSLRCIVSDLCNLVTEDINHKFLVNSKYSSCNPCFIYEDYNASTKMIFLDHGS